MATNATMKWDRPLSPECVAPSFFLSSCLPPRRLPTAHRTTNGKTRAADEVRTGRREGHLTHSRIVFHFLHLATNKRRERHATGRAAGGRARTTGREGGVEGRGREGSIRGSPPQQRESNNVKQLPCLASSPLRPLPPHFNTVGAVKRWRVARRRNLRRAAR